MKNFLLMLLALSFSATAFADDSVCLTAIKKAEASVETKVHDQIQATLICDAYFNGKISAMTGATAQAELATAQGLCKQGGTDPDALASYSQCVQNAYRLVDSSELMATQN